MQYEPNNVFAKILRGELPCKKVFENEHALAIHDIKPQAAVHVVVIQKGEFLDIHDFLSNAGPDQITGFMRAIALTAAELKLPANGYRVISNIGAHGGQEVPHLHVHILGGAPLGSLIGKK